jgi:hypothetical protein
LNEASEQLDYLNVSMPESQKNVPLPDLKG